MPVILCPVCGASVEVDPADVGFKVACPGCQSAIQAGAPPAIVVPPSPPPRAKRSSTVEEEWTEELELDQEDAIRGAARIVAHPALVVKRFGTLGAILCGGVSLVLIVYGFSLFGGTGIDEAYGGQLTQIGAVIGIVGVPLFVMLRLAGKRIPRLSGSGWFHAAGLFGIVSFVLMPFFPVSWATLVFGVWAWLTLRKGEVKAAIRFQDDWRVHPRLLGDDGESTEEDDEDERDFYTFKRGRATMAGPANGLLWLGALGAVILFLVGVFLSIWGLAKYYGPTSRFGFEHAQGVLLLIVGGYALVICFPAYLIMAIGGVRMKRLRNSGSVLLWCILAILGSILAILSPLSWAALIFAIWGLVAVSKPQVREAMRLNSDGRFNVPR